VQINTDTAVYTGLGLSAYTDNGATSHYVRCSCGLLNHERAPNGNKYDYLFDGLGSIVGMTDSNGNDYDPYGVMLNQQEQTGFTNLFKFAGGQYRSSTGLYKFGERYYDPTLGRWTQLDSAGTGYTYANDNPVNEVDPSGTTTIDQWQIFFGITCIVGAGLAVAGLLLSTAGLGFPLIIAAALSGCLLAVIAAFVAVILAHYNLNAAPSS
jgi:RHS repeat-associated protein